MEPCKIPEFWEIQICIDVPIFLLSIWELLSNTLFACTIDYMFFFQFLPLSSSFFRKKLEEIPFFQFLPFFPEETYFFRKFLNPDKHYQTILSYAMFFVKITHCCLCTANWVTKFKFHTPPVEDLRNIPHRGECEFQVDKLIWHFYLK